MPPLHVLVVANAPDVLADVIADAISRRSDMLLVGERIASYANVWRLLNGIAAPMQCALVLVVAKGQDDLDDLTTQWLGQRPGLVIVRLEAGDRTVQFALDNMGLDPVLSALKDLVTRAAGEQQGRILRLHLRDFAADSAPAADAPALPAQRPLLAAAVRWIHAVLRQAVAQLTTSGDDLPGLSVTAATVLRLFDGSVAPTPTSLLNADDQLTHTLATADADDEPLAALAQGLDLTGLEWRLLLLALAPELDARYQRCMGLLLDDLGRRVGTLGLYAALLGVPADVRRHLAASRNLVRWRLLDSHNGTVPAADEPLRLDPAVIAWLMGDSGALDRDAHLRHLVQLAPWPGAALVAGGDAAQLVNRVLSRDDAHWLILADAESSGWRALLEAGAQDVNTAPVRVALRRIAGADISDIEESAIRVGRIGRLTGRPVIVDATGANAPLVAGDGVEAFFAALGETACRAAVICTDAARIVGFAGILPCVLADGALAASARLRAFRAAASGAGVTRSETAARTVASQYPLPVDALDRAMRLACLGASGNGAPDAGTRFLDACKQVAAEGLSRLAERIEPAFTLDDVILPDDGRQQLIDIADSIRLRAKVLDDWKFGALLPYGRGVTALFHGPSGTGKTMAAMAVAHRLGVQLLRLDFSRVVSKYIGDTEKNIDRVFDDARQSGCAILIDEADALLGKRSEVKDAHDRYANIEVAYLLQRMEAYEGLAILTTNLRQNLDTAFLRRLRFIVDFPRPDAGAREEIWRRCLPVQAHTLDAHALRLLARRIELTGGHIRQMTLRAAFIAAAADQPIGWEHIVRAAQAEYAKLGMPAPPLNVPDARRAA